MKNKSIKKLLRKFNFYLFSIININKNNKYCKDVRIFCTFIGNGRSGSTLVGALLDAHPNIVIANELDILKHVHFKYNKKMLYSILLEGNKEFVKKEYRGAGGYKYNIPNQWQGKFKKIEIIGNKKITKSTIRLQKNQNMLSKLRKLFNLRLKFICTIRNPYDNISTQIIRKNKSSNKDIYNRTINSYFNNLSTVKKLEKQIPKEDIIYIKLEALIKNPKRELKKLCRFFGVEPTKDYLNDCASTIYKKPHKSRYDINWTPKLIALVKKEINKYPFLRGYSYEK